MINRIILTTDFSDNSRKAADFVYSNFKDAKIIFYHAYGTPQVGHSVLISIDDILEKDARSEMTLEEKRLSQKFPNSSCSLEKVLINGDFSLGLRDTIKNRMAQLVVMGTKGAGAIQGKLFGSTASKMIGKSELPVLLIPDSYIENPKGAIKKIALASDLKAVVNLTFIEQFVKEISPEVDTELDVIYINKEDHKLDENDKDDLLDSLKSLHPKFHKILSEDVTDGIERFVHLNNHDLLIMIHRQHSFMERLFKSSISKNLALSVTVPTLILHE
jgi:nucleotide-binding universal stress UspA family protein